MLALALSLVAATSSKVTFISIVLNIIQIVPKQLSREKKRTIQLIMQTMETV